MKSSSHSCGPHRLNFDTAVSKANGKFNMTNDHKPVDLGVCTPFSDKPMLLQENSKKYQQNETNRLRDWQDTLKYSRFTTYQKSPMNQPKFVWKSCNHTDAFNHDPKQSFKKIRRIFTQETLKPPSSCIGLWLYI